MEQNLYVLSQQLREGTIIKESLTKEVRNAIQVLWIKEYLQSQKKS